VASDSGEEARDGRPVRHSRRAAMAALGLGGVATLLVGACTAPAGPRGDAPGTEEAARLTWWSRGTQEWNEMMLEVAGAYMAAYPKISIDYAFQPSEGYTDRIITAAASDTLPDVFHLNSQDTISLAAKGVLQDVSGLLARDGRLKKGDFFPWAFLRAEKDGKTYGMPLKGTCNVMYVNHSLFEREGLPLPAARWTWADYVQTARRLTHDPTTPGGIWGGWSYPWQAAVWQNGGDLVDKAGKKALIAETPAVEAIQWVADLILKERVHPRSNEAPEIRTLAVPFSSGRVAMLAGAEPDFGNLLKITDFKWGAAPLPLAAPGKAQASQGASTLFGLSPRTKAQPQAWAFLTWLTTQRAPQEIINRAGKLGVPPYKPIYDTLFLNQPPRQDVKQVLGEMALANRPYLETLTTVPEVERVFSAELAHVWSGNTTAREATKRIAEQMTPLLNQA
jgi:multiple sugar transport system substrate-binding protein